jgi:hypothetical protein
MARSKSEKPNLVSFTFRIEQEHLDELELYSKTIDKSQSQIIAELVRTALANIPKKQRQVMEIIDKSRSSD